MRDDRKSLTPSSFREARVFKDAEEDILRHINAGTVRRLKGQPNRLYFVNKAGVEWKHFYLDTEQNHLNPQDIAPLQAMFVYILRDLFFVMAQKNISEDGFVFVYEINRLKFCENQQLKARNIKPQDFNIAVTKLIPALRLCVKENNKEYFIPAFYYHQDQNIITADLNSLKFFDKKTFPILIAELQQSSKVPLETLTQIATVNQIVAHDVWSYGFEIANTTYKTFYKKLSVLINDLGLPSDSEVSEAQKFRNDCNRLKKKPKTEAEKKKYNLANNAGRETLGKIDSHLKALKENKAIVDFWYSFDKEGMTRIPMKDFKYKTYQKSLNTDRELLLIVKPHEDQYRKQAEYVSEKIQKAQIKKQREKNRHQKQQEKS